MISTLLWWYKYCSWQRQENTVTFPILALGLSVIAFFLIYLSLFFVLMTVTLSTFPPEERLLLVLYSGLGVT